jgi:hypothetical protein
MVALKRLERKVASPVTVRRRRLVAHLLLLYCIVGDAPTVLRGDHERTA